MLKKITQDLRPTRIPCKTSGNENECEIRNFESGRTVPSSGSKLLSEIHEIINSLWNKEELPQQWKEFVILQIYQKDDQTECHNY
jgi:hypothetical protein